MAAAVFQIVQLFFALLAAFFFLALVFGHFFVGHLVILAARRTWCRGASSRAEMGIAAFFRLPAPKPPMLRIGSAMAPASTSKLADLLEKIVQVVGLERVGKPSRSRIGCRSLVRSCGTRKSGAERIGAGWPSIDRHGRLGFGELLEDGEERSAYVGQRQVDDGQIPRARGQFGQGVADERDDADAPALGIEDVFQRTLAGDIVVNDQNSDFGHGWVSTRCLIQYIERQR